MNAEAQAVRIPQGAPSFLFINRMLARTHRQIVEAWKRDPGFKAAYDEPETGFARLREPLAARLRVCWFQRVGGFIVDGFLSAVFPGGSLVVPAPSGREGLRKTRPYFFCSFGAFVFSALGFSVLAFDLLVFPGGTHPQPQSFLSATRLTSFPVVPSILPVARDGIRRCTVLRSYGGAGIPESSSPPSVRSAPGASSSRREAVSVAPLP